MVPTIGRIVVYKTTEEDRKKMDNTSNCNTQKELPAIIVAVWGNQPTSCVNLQILCDGELGMWKTSVNWGENEGQCHWPLIAQ